VGGPEDAQDPLELYVEIRDKATDGYWTRVNYSTVVPPGSSTFILPIRQLYVGEKSRPGRPLISSGITRLVFSIGDKPPAIRTTRWTAAKTTTRGATPPPEAS